RCEVVSTAAGADVAPTLIMITTTTAAAATSSPPTARHNTVFFEPGLRCFITPEPNVAIGSNRSRGPVSMRGPLSKLNAGASSVLARLAAALTGSGATVLCEPLASFGLPLTPSPFIVAAGDAACGAVLGPASQP